MIKIFWLMIAGGAGAVSRYGVTYLTQRWMAQTFNTSFPLGTMIVNVAGSFLLAFLTISVIKGTIPSHFGFILGTGFLGAFTTFSTFGLESHGLLTSGTWTQAALYILGNLLLGIIAVILGSSLALRLFAGHA